MRNVSKHKGLRCVITLLSVIMLFALPGCAWIEEFDAQGRPEVIDVYHSAEPLRIAWVNSYSEESLASMALQTGMLETLGRAGYSKPIGTLEWKSFHLNAKGNESFALLRYRAEYFITEIKAYDPDIIITSDDEAAMTLAPIYPDHDVPIIFVGVTTDQQVTGLGQPNITGIPELLHVKETLTAARTMIPVQGRILILGDGSLTGKASVNSAIAIVASSPDEFPPIMELATDWDEWQAAVQAHHADVDMILIASHHALTDAESNHVSGKRMVSWTKANSDAPVFGFSNTAVSNGAVAGLVTDPYDYGRTAAEMVIYVANGGDISMTGSELLLTQSNRLVLNLEAARHWSLEVPMILTITADVQDPQGGGN